MQNKVQLKLVCNHDLLMITEDFMTLRSFMPHSDQWLYSYLFHIASLCILVHNGIHIHLQHLHRCHQIHMVMKGICWSIPSLENIALMNIGWSKEMNRIGTRRYRKNGLMPTLWYSVKTLNSMEKHWRPLVVASVMSRNLPIAWFQIQRAQEAGELCSVCKFIIRKTHTTLTHIIQCCIWFSDTTLILLSM